ncbi:MAG: 50S ribosomal protein L25 [Patescibacteria group bacterium]
MTGQTYSLETTTRDTSIDATKVREQKNVPLVLYGRGEENLHIVAGAQPFSRVASEAGESALIDLKIDGKDVGKVLIKDIQRHPVKDHIIHADLYKIDMNQKLTTEIPLSFVGVAPAVKELGGIMVKHLDSVEVSCLPGDLVAQIEVDVSNLVDFTSSVLVSDLKLPEGIEVLNDSTVSVLNVSEPRKVEEIEKPSEETAEGEQAEGEQAEGEAKPEGETSEAEEKKE